MLFGFETVAKYRAPAGDRARPDLYAAGRGRICRVPGASGSAVSRCGFIFRAPRNRVCRSTVSSGTRSVTRCRRRCIEAGYREVGLDARYVTFEPDADGAVAAVEGADALGVAGLNVTIPFKRDVLDAVDPDPLAERIGAVNTIDFRGGDAERGTTRTPWVPSGRSGARRHHRGDRRRRRCGRRGRAVAFGLADEGMTVGNRQPNRRDGLLAR